jgi:lipopolysaccharide export system permease protein
MRLLDRYVLFEFVKLLLLSLFAFIIIFAIVDLFEKIQDFMDGHASAWIVARYYAYKIPWVTVQVLPVALLMATFLTLGQMSKFNELTAMVTAGLSTGRIVVPLFGVGLVAVLASFALNELVVPNATRQREEILETEVRHRLASKPTEYSNLSVLGRDGRIYTAKLYLVPEKRLIDVTITEFKGDVLTRRIDAPTARWNGRQWVLEDGVERAFDKRGERAQTFTVKTLTGTAEDPEEFEKDPENPDEMAYGRLAEYVRRLEHGGLRAEKYEVQLHQKFAFPFINLIVVVIGTALAARLRNPNAALGFGVSVSTAFFYVGLMRAGQALGQSGTLPPVLAAWFANGLLGLVALGLFLQAQRR